MSKTKESRHALFRSDLALNARRIIARRLRLRQLDLQHLHLPSKLEHLVLNLAVLQRVGVRARRGLDRGVELVRLRGLGGLAHRLHVGRDGVVERGEVEARERVDEDGVRFGFGVARGAVGDLEVGVAVKDGETVPLAPRSCSHL